MWLLPRTFAFPISVMSQHNPPLQMKRLRLGEVSGKKKKKSRSSDSKSTFFLFSQAGLCYPTRKGLCFIYWRTEAPRVIVDGVRKELDTSNDQQLTLPAPLPEPRRVPGTYSAHRKCFSNEWVHQGAGRNHPAQCPPLELGDQGPSKGVWLVQGQTGP